jgi:hypothetical protein
MIKRLSRLGALLSLGICLAAPVLFFAGTISEGGYKLAFNLASAGWFVLASLWLMKRTKKGPSSWVGS